MNRYVRAFKKRIEKDYEEICIKLKKLKKVELINKAYEIAHYNEIVDVVDCFDEEYPPFENNELKLMCRIKGNLLQIVYDSWLSYCHPERYNFFAYEDLIDIIHYALVIMKRNYKND